MIPSPAAGELIGGIGLTHLTVYDQRPAPDGKMSGCAHVHAVTDEGYYVIGGRGEVELHDVEHGFRALPLARGSYVQFSPGTVHRTVSAEGLEVLVIMANAGLAERGDARIYFGPAVDRDPAEYARLRALPRKAGIDGALERRDASVAAYVELMKLWESNRDRYRSELRRFIRVHRDDMAARREELESVLAAGPEFWCGVVRGRIEGLPAAPGAAESRAAPPEGGGAILGMCGILRPLHGLGSV